MKNNQNVVIYCLLIIIVALVGFGGTYIYSLQQTVASTDSTTEHPPVCMGSDKYNILTGALCSKATTTVAATSTGY